MTILLNFGEIFDRGIADKLDWNVSSARLSDIFYQGE